MLMVYPVASTLSMERNKSSNNQDKILLRYNKSLFIVIKEALFMKAVRLY